MKTNVSIELSEQERSALADLIDGKATKRLATRKEITKICQQHIGGMSHQTVEAFESAAHGTARKKYGDIYKVDHSDPLSRTMAQPHNPGYVRGWNLVKGGAA